MIRRFYQNHRALFQKLDTLWLRSPILTRGLAIAPLIVVCNSVLRACALSLCYGLMLVLTVIFSRPIPQTLPYTIRVILNVSIAAILFIPASYLTELWFPGSLSRLGLYLPLLTVSSLIVQHTPIRFHRMPFRSMVLDLILNAGGFFLLAVCLGFVRELLGRGQLYGTDLSISFTVPAILLPFSGFLLMGMAAALAKKVYLFLNRTPRSKRKEKRNHE